MLKKIVLAVIALSSCTPPAAALCPPYDHTVNIRVIKDYGELVYDNSRSYEDFHRVAGARYSKDTKGLTIAEFDLSVSAEASNYSYDDGSHCVYLDSVDLYLTYKNILVLIDKKYKPGSCQHNVILNHENQHVMVHKRSLDYYAPYIIGAMEKALASIQPVLVKNASDTVTETAVNKILDDLMKKISPMLDFFEEERDKANAKLDTEDNYRKEQGACPKW